jgi:hypothetical protein
MNQAAPHERPRPAHGLYPVTSLSLLASRIARFRPRVKAAPISSANSLAEQTFAHAADVVESAVRLATGLSFRAHAIVDVDFPAIGHSVQADVGSAADAPSEASDDAD